MELSEKKLPDHRKEAVLVFGNADSAKTAVSSIVTRDLKKFTIYEDDNKELVIIDEDGEITSSSFIPKLFRDKKTNISIIDFASFEDRGIPKVEVTVKYLIKEAIANVPSFKIILVIPEASMNVNEDNEDFDNILTSICELIPNVDTNNRSIGLIVSKVAANDDNGETRSDDTVLEDIKQFLQKYISERQSNNQRSFRDSSNPSTTGNNRGRYKRKIENIYQTYRDTEENEKNNDNRGTSDMKVGLAKIFLNSNRVAFLRAPTECGEFSRSFHAAKDKKQMTELIKRLKKFPNDDPSRFKYSWPSKLDSEAITEIQETISDVNSNITTLVDNLVEYIGKSQFQITTATVMRDFYAIKNWVLSDHEVFSIVPENFLFEDSEKTPEALGRLMYLSLSQRDYDTTPGVKFQFRLRKISEKIAFFQEILPEGTSLALEPQQWIKPFNKWIEEDAEPRKSFYVFLDDLRETLGKLDFQNRKSSITSVPRDIAGVKAMLGSKGNLVTPTVETYFNSRKDPMVDHIMKEICEEALVKTKVECGSSFTFLKGGVIRTSEIIDSSNRFACSGTPPPPPPPPMLSPP